MSAYHSKLFHVNAASFDNAELACESTVSGSHLVTITNELENDIVRAYMLTKGIGTGWIGLKEEPLLAWVNPDYGTNVPYLNYLPDQPDRHEDCIEFLSASGRWNDLTCTVGVC